jgi:hypothetical protein
MLWMWKQMNTRWYECESQVNSKVKEECFIAVLQLRTFLRV